MEINVPLNHKDDIESLINAGASSITLGAKDLSLRFETSYDKTEILEILTFCQDLDVKIYVALNRIMHNKDIPLLKEWLLFLSEYKPDALIFNDLSVYQLVKSMKLSFNLHFDSEMMITNSKMVNYWHRQGVSRVTLANELTLDEYVELEQKSECEIEILGQGLINMFHSIRPLVTRYNEYLEHDELKELVGNHDLHLYDEERDLNYPIVQDENGTHIMSGREISVIDELSELYPNVHIKISGFLQTRDYVIEMTKLYKRAIDALSDGTYKNKRMSLYMNAQSVAKRPLDKGFFFKPTMYKVK